ncbi:kinase-like domain-containing protein [Hyaloraphidium curvatum]|nr:kinase-like domain-containing protein [Hyaloraphidium curvatum]
MSRDHTAVSNARVSSERTLCDVPGAEPGAMDAFSSRGKGADTPPKGGLLRGLVDTWIPVGNDTLGKGGFSEARLVRGELAGREAVAKTTVLPASDPTDRVLFHSLREALALVHMPPHKSLPKILDFLHADGTVHLVMTRAPGQSQELYSYVNSQPQGRLPEREARLIVANLLEVLRHCHAHGVLHRDVKLDNVMWDPTSQQLTLIDFGLATFFNDRTMFTEAVGCINYASCAMLRFVNQRRPYSGAKGHPDLWALGVLTHGLLTGYFPFRSEEMATLQREIESLGTLHIEGASSEALDFLSIVLDPRNEGRFTAASLLSHPWVAGLVPTGRLFPRKPPPRVPAPYGDCKRACVAAATELARLLPLHLRTKMRDEPTPAVGCLPDPLDNAPDTRIA